MEILKAEDYMKNRETLPAQASRTAPPQRPWLMSIVMQRGSTAALLLGEPNLGFLNAELLSWFWFLFWWEWGLVRREGEGHTV